MNNKFMLKKNFEPKKKHIFLLSVDALPGAQGIILNLINYSLSILAFGFFHCHS